MSHVARILCAAVTLASAGNTAHAALVTDVLAFPSPNALVTFDEFTTRVNGAGPVQVGTPVGENIIFTSTDPSSFVGITTGYGLLANGSWEPNKGPFVGSNAASELIFTFNSGPVNSVGSFLNYAPTSSILVSVFNSGNTLLESYDLSVVAPISTPGGVNAGAFRGIVRPTADIAIIRFTNSGTTAVAVDDLRFSRGITAAPEPGTLALLALAALPISAVAVRRRRKA